MSRSIRVSEEFHEFICSHKREDETFEETLRRMIGGPHPEAVAGILSSGTAEEMRERLETPQNSDVKDERSNGELSE